MTPPDTALDRLIEFDERSRQYPVSELLTADNTQPRSYTWKVPVRLNQGTEGACVGFAWTHEAAARPVEIPNATNAVARSLYRQAQRLDSWPGENYSGTSVLAGAKAAQEMGWLGEYRWGFDLMDVVKAISRNGPVVLGIPWYRRMYTPDAKGFIRGGGEKVGGHAILANGVNVKDKTVTLTNSWGTDWGQGGACRILWNELEALLDEEGECCVPVRRLKPKG